MALPLAFAISVVPAKADLARGEAEYLRGNAHCDAREFSDALASYDRAAAFGYEDHVMWNNRGVALDGLGRHEDSIQAYTRALQHNPKYEIAAYNLGNAFAQLGQFEEALVAYDRALAINPAYADALYDKALVLARLGRARPSLQAYEALVRADSGNVVAWTRKGQLLEELNKFDEAVDAYNAATAAKRIPTTTAWSMGGRLRTRLLLRGERHPVVDRATDPGIEARIVADHVLRQHRIPRHPPAWHHFEIARAGQAEKFCAIVIGETDHPRIGEQPGDEVAAHEEGRVAEHLPSLRLREASGDGLEAGDEGRRRLLERRTVRHGRECILAR